jgi:hypothetical protein
MATGRPSAPPHALLAEWERPELLELAKILKFEFERMDHNDDPPWDELEDFDKEFYLHLVRGLLSRPELLTAAIGVQAPDHRKIGRAL